MINAYIDIIQLVPRLHRQFMDVIKVDLQRLRVDDINNVQSILLFNIGDARLSVGELTLRGVYLGSNVSYNLKKMVENGYLTLEQSPEDRRVSHVRATEKGRRLQKELTTAHQRRAEVLSEAALSEDALQTAITVLRQLDRLLGQSS